jgi:hypothetical protein
MRALRRLWQGVTSWVVVTASGIAGGNLWCDVNAATMGSGREDPCVLCGPRVRLWTVVLVIAKASMPVKCV